MTSEISISEVMDKVCNTFQVSVENVTPSLPCTNECTLLESLESHKLEVHSHCREGFCGACRTKLISGTVDYVTDPLAYIDDDEILPCCCIPTSNLVIKPG
ncbi:class I ribonucleotide reductase maintenance protein YfaE [Lacimicrobium sp. SS2-24]|uniref:class I ribonucleotide reductase maintenance protein YfaE n=1 Tax=Lacimicrobium sp. SS2-24 TaxID=2005569 RepID=UPI00248B98F3|nr:class I ribonucleotide reductase maintenance protein YfaE [Lacimicrobium sp. SS2-24]